MIRIALPNKGRLAEPARDLLRRTGLRFSGLSGRVLQARLGEHLLAIFVSTSDIPEFVADGATDLGITGGDLIAESDRDLDPVLDLGFGRCRLVVATRDEDTIRTIADIPDGAPVATSFPGLARRFFEAANKRITVVPVSGAAEIAPHIGVADVIVDLVATGSTLKINGLREVETVLESEASLIARPGLRDDPAAAAEVSALSDALESVIRARDKRYLMANVPRQRLEEVRQLLPGISGPTIIDVLDGGEVVAAHAVVEQAETYRLINDLRRIGATGILVTKIERLSP